MPSDPPTSQSQLDAISYELHALRGQSQTAVLRRLFTALAHGTGVQSGYLFLSNEQGQPEYCLILEAGRLSEYDETTAPPLHEQGLTAWVYRQRRGVLVTDTATDPRWPSWAAAYNESPALSALAVPIMATDQPIGALALVADRTNHFGETDLALITNITAQAALIVENSHLNARLSQQQHIIDSLRETAHTINTSRGLDQLLYTVLNQLPQAIPHQGAMILLREDERLQLVAAKGFTAATEREHQVFTATDSPLLFRALNQGRTVIIDAVQEPISLGTLTPPNPIRTLAIAPLMARGESLGLVVLVSHEPHAYHDPDIASITTFADHITIAVANNRLTQETDQRLRELAFLNETGQAITSTLNLAHILQVLLERVRELLHIDAASIALRDEKTGELVFEAASGEGSAGVLGVRLKPGQGIAGWVAETGKPLIVHDVYKDARFYSDVDKQTGMTTQAILCVPIVLKGHIVGIIEALNPGEVSFDKQAVELLSALAGLAATAIHNARLFAQVHSAEARYEGLFEDSVNPIIITDLKGNIVDVNRNACFLLRQTKEALLGTNITHFRSASDSLDFADPHQQMLTGQEVIFQTDILDDGQRTTIEIRGKQIPVQETTLIQWIGRNISAEVELEQTRDDMVHMIIHDLRNPLANIMNSVAVLQDVLAENDESVSLDELFNIARRSGKRMQQLINSILDISRLETGQAILETQPTDPLPLLHDAVKFVTPQAEISDIQLITNLAPDLPQIEIDRDMISRVVLNLLDNAIKFTQVGGTVTLTAQALDLAVEIRVADNGPGIPADQLQNIFEKFVRVHRKTGPKGTGLGLAFCHLAVQAHRGHIWAASELGQGTTIHCILPVDPSIDIVLP